MHSRLPLLVYSGALLQDIYLLSWASFFPSWLDHPHQHRNISLKYLSLALSLSISFSFLCPLPNKPSWNSPPYSSLTTTTSYVASPHHLDSSCQRHQLATGNGDSSVLFTQQTDRIKVVHRLLLVEIPSSLGFWRPCSWFSFLFCFSSSVSCCSFSSPFCPFNVRVPRAHAWSSSLLELDLLPWWFYPVIRLAVASICWWFPNVYLEPRRPFRIQAHVYHVLPILSTLECLGDITNSVMSFPGNLVKLIHNIYV